MNWPQFLQVQSLSRVCPVWKISIFQIVWTGTGQTLDFNVQSLSMFFGNQQRLDRDWTRIGQRLDRLCTWLVIGQGQDRAWTTGRQRLDFVSRPCLAIHRVIVPIICPMQCVFRPTCFTWIIYSPKGEQNSTAPATLTAGLRARSTPTHIDGVVGCGYWAGVVVAGGLFSTGTRLPRFTLFF